MGTNACLLLSLTVEKNSVFFFNELRNMIEIDFELKMSSARPRIIAGNEKDN